jgi:hypothetical protein
MKTKEKDTEKKGRDRRREINTGRWMKESQRRDKVRENRGATNLK